MKPSILQLNSDQLAQWFADRGEPGYRAAQLRRWIFDWGVHTFGQMTDLPRRLRENLAAEFVVFGSRLETRSDTPEGTSKLLLRLADEQRVECVLLAEENRRTVCVSTQVGCAMGCVFCASGLDGVVRNLESYEIVEQFLWARNQLPEAERLTHAVIMGMGEPMANLDNLLAGLEVVCSGGGLNLSQRRITISTIGLPQGIRRLAEASCGYCLAVSLHAPDDQLRSQLVPPNARTGIAAVLEAADYFFLRTGRQVTFEYVLLQAVNDSQDHARSLGRLLSDRKVHVNLIPYNPVTGLPYQRPRPQAVRGFADTLRRTGISVTIRKTKGRRIDAACGQLRLASRRPAWNKVRGADRP